MEDGGAGWGHAAYNVRVVLRGVVAGVGKAVEGHRSPSRWRARGGEQMLRASRAHG